MRTDLFAELRSGSRESVDRLVPLLYQELRAIAALPNGGFAV